MIYPKIISKIKESKKIAIMSHIMPDGDNVGSCLALYNALKKSGKAVRLILDDDIPKIYKFLKGSDEVIRPGQYESFDIVIALDCGDAERLGKSRLYLDNNFVINIDHHISNNEFGNLNMVDTNASATGEIIYHIIRILGIDMDRDISECLYTAIVTDTGQFQYSNTTSITHQIAGDLINNGVNVSLMFERIYQNVSKEKVVLMKTALSSLEFYHNDRISCVSLTLEQMKKANAMDEDSDGIINLARDIECVEAAIFLKELETGKIKVGLRSKKIVDVAAVALKFGGGGHVRAAGCTLNGTVAEVKEEILDAVIAEFRGTK
ncbi:MAG TPA: bifunctional oligoribonuclease/PAP phosphatase NrnA [Clostridia bacterium]|nr:bifunctional oligoribonuclease/PAP phosphatase NrnA [Clostridia bacterium]